MALVFICFVCMFVCCCFCLFLGGLFSVFLVVVFSFNESIMKPISELSADQSLSC